MRTKAEVGLVQLPAKEQQTLFKATWKLKRGNVDFVPRPFRWRMTLPTPWSWTSGSKSMKERISVVWRSPLCGSLLWQPEQTLRATMGSRVLSQLEQDPVSAIPGSSEKLRSQTVRLTQSDLANTPFCCYGHLLELLCHFFASQSFFKKYLFIYLFGCSGSYCSIHDLCCDMWNLRLQHAGSSSLTKDWTWAHCVGKVESQPLDSMLVHCFPILKNPSTSELSLNSQVTLFSYNRGNLEREAIYDPVFRVRIHSWAQEILHLLVEGHWL